MSKTRRYVTSTVALVAWLVSAGGSASGQEPESSSLAAELSRLMAAAQLEAVAGKDTVDDDRYVAALAFSGQLLVVSARYEVPRYIDEKIANRQFRDVYIDLNTASIHGSKVLITDIGANGLREGGGAGGVDMFDDGSGMIRLDGTASGTAIATANEHYTRMLRALIASAR